MPCVAYSPEPELGCGEPAAHLLEVPLFVLARRFEARDELFVAALLRVGDEQVPGIVVDELRHQNGFERLYERRARIDEHVHDAARERGGYVGGGSDHGWIAAELHHGFDQHTEVQIFFPHDLLEVAARRSAREGAERIELGEERLVETNPCALERQAFTELVDELHGVRPADALNGGAREPAYGEWRGHAPHFVPASRVFFTHDGERAVVDGGRRRKLAGSFEHFRAELG